MEITIIYKQSGLFWTAAAFIGEAYAGMATCSDKQLAGAQARAYAQSLAAQPLPPAAARLGGRAKVTAFSTVLAKSGRWPLAVVQAAQLAALEVPMPADAPVPA